jgi:hypothetical protein
VPSSSLLMFSSQIWDTNLTDNSKIGDEFEFKSWWYILLITYLVWNSSPILELSVKFVSQICHENINKPLDGAYLADFGIDITLHKSRGARNTPRLESDNLCERIFFCAQSLKPKNNKKLFTFRSLPKLLQRLTKGAKRDFPRKYDFATFQMKYISPQIDHILTKNTSWYFLFLLNCYI